MSENWEKQKVHSNLLDYADDNKLRWKMEAADKRAKEQHNGTETTDQPDPS